ETVLATNTSALSVRAMAEHLRHPERVVGLHFFNPVAQMPLVELVRTPECSDEAVATAFAVAKDLRKTAAAAADRPGCGVTRPPPRRTPSARRCARPPSARPPGRDSASPAGGYACSPRLPGGAGAAPRPRWPTRRCARSGCRWVRSP